MHGQLEFLVAFQFVAGVICLIKTVLLELSSEIYI